MSGITLELDVVDPTAATGTIPNPSGGCDVKRAAVSPQGGSGGEGGATEGGSAGAGEVLARAGNAGSVASVGSGGTAGSSGAAQTGGTAQTGGATATGGAAPEARPQKKNGDSSGCAFVPARASMLPFGILVTLGLLISRRRASGGGPWLENQWDSKPGRGVVTDHQAGEGTLKTSFHVAYPGYTGGLVIGGYSSSGMAWVPERPKPGYGSINVVCAQDESIWDRDERREYTYGWSENFGTGPDGERLNYVSGRVIEATRERIALMSENRGGCYEVRKITVTWARARFWILATRIKNRCAHPIHFDFCAAQGRTLLTIVRQPFVPDREMVVIW